MANKIDEILLYVKKVSFNTEAKNGKSKTQSFNKFLCKYKGTTFDCTIETKCREKLEKQMESESLTFPVKLYLDIEHEDYFVKHETFKRNDGSWGDKYIVVIMDYQKIVQDKFDTKITLEDIYK